MPCGKRPCSRIDMEKKLQTEMGSTERKNRQLLSLGRKESQYLRLRRTRLGLDDFVTVKVIGKGAFGEVRSILSTLHLDIKFIQAKSSSPF